MANQKRLRRQYLGTSDRAQQYIDHCTSRDGCCKCLRFGFDAAQFADGKFGPELETLKALADEFGDELEYGWIQRRITELEGGGDGL